MSRTQLRKIRGDLFSRKARTLLVAMSIFVGVLGVVTLTSTGNLFMDQLREDLREDQMPMMLMGVSSSTDNTTPSDAEWQATANLLQLSPEVTAVERYSSGRLFWKSAGEEHFIESRLRGYVSPLDQLSVEAMQLVDGSYPVSGQHQVAVERQMADAFDIQVGDTLDVALVSQLSGEQGTGGSVPSEPWMVSAIVFHPFSAGDSNINRVFVAYADAVYLNDAPENNIFLLRFTDVTAARNAEEAIKAQVNNQPALEVDFLRVEDPAQNPFLEEMKGWTNTLTALSFISMIVSSLLVVTVILTVVIEQRRQIGALKSLGATRWNNFTIYAGLAMAYGLVGTIPAVLLGIPAGYLLLKVISPLVGLLVDGFLISWSAVLIGVAMGLFVPLVASIIPVLLGTRVSIREAMTDLGIGSSFGRGFVSRTIQRLPLPVAMRQAVANAYQKRGRLLLTGFTLTLAAGAFMGIAGMFISVNNSMGDLFDAYYVDLIVTPSDSDFSYAQVNTLLTENVENVAVIHPSAGYWAETVIAPAQEPGSEDETQWVSLRGIDPADSIVNLELEQGQSFTETNVENAAVLGNIAANSLGKSVGDTLTLELDDDTTMVVNIVGVTSAPVEDVIMPWQTVAALSNRTEPTQLWVEFTGEPTGADVDRTIAEVRDMLLANGVVADFDNIRADQEANVNVMMTVGIIFNIASLVMAVVGAIGLLTMLSISVFERQREIGVMRSIGASSWAIVSQFLTEGLVIGMTAWAVGVPLSYLVGKTLLDVLPMEGMEFNYPMMVLAAGFLGMMFLTTLASVWPSVSAARRTVSDILRYE